MTLLITTQAVDIDDPILGFFHSWIAELAGCFDSIEVICLREGRHDLPQNVHVHSLGKERQWAGRSVLLRVRYAWRFWRYAWRLRSRYDAVFVHMNPEYVVLAGFFWRLSHKRIVLWYTHRQVTILLRIALLFSHAVGTAAPESLRLKSPKVHVIGHGIDTAAFSATHEGTLHDPIALLSVGRITPIKRLEILLEALALLSDRGVHAALTLVGAPVMPGDFAYQETLLAHARSLGIEDRVHFVGARPYRDMPAMYRSHDASINLAPTGGIDKAVLESMAAGVPPLVANRAFGPLFGGDASRLIFDASSTDLADKLRAFVNLSVSERAALSARLAAQAVAQADLSQTISRLCTLLT